MKVNFYPKLIIRTPFYPINSILTISFEDIMKLENFREGLYLASPDLYKEVYGSAGIISPNAQLSVWKYFNRMSTRCTPYGLFAGSGIVCWSEKTNIIRSTVNILRRTRLDKEYLNKLTATIIQEKSIFKQLRFSLNNSLNKIDNDYRLIERDEVSSKLKLSNYKGNELIKLIVQTLDKQSLTYYELANLIAPGNQVPGKVFKFLKQLHQDQLFTTELNSSLPADGQLGLLISIISGLSQKTQKTESLLKSLLYLQKNLLSLDKKGFGQQSYQKLTAYLRKQVPHQAENRILQLDYTYQQITGGVASNIQKHLCKGIEILSAISTIPPQSEKLNDFKRKFFKKYGGAEVPLLAALDPETGIDFTNNSAMDSFLVDVLNFNLSTDRVKNLGLNENLIYLLKKSEGLVGEVFTLTDPDLQKMHCPPPDLPATTSVFFRIIGKDKIQIDHIGGCSGINLFSRFTDFDPNLHQMAKEICELDEQKSGDYILAEVVHEPEKRSGNVTAHSTYRKYEIPYLTKGILDESQQIYLQDINVSLINNQIILRSKRLNKLIKPMISHACNFHKASPIYQFFGCLQTESSRSLSFDFRHILPGKCFYPRVVYKNVVLSAASWDIDFCNITNSENIINLKKYLTGKRIPQLFLMTEGDNELLIDQSKEELLNIFFVSLKKKGTLQIKEFLFDEDNLIRNENNNQLNNQLVAIIDNSSNNKPDTSPYKFQRNPDNIRKFHLGSEWLYYKLYCGVISADKIIADSMSTLIDILKRDNLIKQGFFIRYSDPEPHIRLRFELAAIENLQACLNVIYAHLFIYIKSNTIWKLQTETYDRELERYGQAIEESEKIFHIDSYSIASLLSMPDICEEILLRISAGIRLVLDLIELVIDDQENSIAFCKRMKSTLRADLEINHEHDYAIKGHFDSHQQKLRTFLTCKQLTKERIFLKRKNKIAIEIKHIRCKNESLKNQHLEDLLASYNHMTINRLFVTNQKTYEYLIYYHLFKILNIQMSVGFSKHELKGTNN